MYEFVNKLKKEKKGRENMYAPSSLANNTIQLSGWLASNIFSTSFLLACGKSRTLDAKQSEIKMAKMT